KIVVKGWSIPITGTVWPLVVAAVKLGVAAHDPSGITWTVAADQAIDALTKLAELIHKLDPTERLVFAPIAESPHEHKKAHVAPDGASCADIGAWFDKSERVKPSNLDAVVDGLVENHVLKKTNDPARGALYTLAF